MDETSGTTFQEVYDFFLAGITDDMFMELTPEDTRELLQEILFSAMPHFEFPRKDIFDVNISEGRFNVKLTLEEMSILRQYMIVEWIGYQLASIDNIRQKYSGSDFSFTSQAAHIDKLIAMRDHYKDEGYRLQRLYCRRLKSAKKPGYESSFMRIMEKR